MDSPEAARVEIPGPAYGDAAYNGGGGELADAITNGDRIPAIEGPKVIPGVVEDAM